ncbi:MAG: hypothetical protein K2H97_06570 [Prevotella sp.]|nr:hypothetical protein [Prevotella sp.]
MTSNNIKSTIKGIWNFLVGISNIGSCLLAAISCFLAYNAVLEVISLNVEINQIIENFQKDSVVIIERPVPILVQKDSFLENRSEIRPDSLPKTKQNLESDTSPNLSPAEIDEIRRDRDAFLKKMHQLFGNRKHLQ